MILSTVQMRSSSCIVSYKPDGRLVLEFAVVSYMQSLHSAHSRSSTDMTILQQGPLLHNAHQDSDSRNQMVPGCIELGS